MPDTALRRHCHGLHIWIKQILLCGLLALPQPCFASEARADPHHICDRAADQASRSSGVPLEVLLAITRTETGRRRNGQTQPWPWTVNMEGHGLWFQSRAEALAYATRHQAGGATRFDIGCFQINYHWHGAAFASLDAMFDPDTNARYAAAFLTRLQGELGSWDAAAGAYHSRRPEHATNYLARYHQQLAALDTPATIDTAPVADPRPADRPNRFPLLQSGAAASAHHGSLVPRLTGGARALFRHM
ncbi:lytic transglycosylase domain-containing protein [Rhodophyticola sp. CCM32]|uniref:transglycosylase SLT domain-containing protein n=1 Tax=Rhodophyticola sp. CCM32 TaxID=2916397 RepID=UPI00107F950C|nr:transglycosylase SLT domain-containing protein [Rhodophyticola sp. CCM32]QBY02223.1 lytic transglycosylase domain-containing protein [Rhodophyticola sp. CCM32]